MSRRSTTYLIFPILFSLLSSCTDPASKLPNDGSVPDFTMTDSHGRPFNRKMMSGTVWIVDFIYTNCPAACPRMTSKMHRIAQELQGDDNVGLLSISVDPDRDTPAVLNQFANRYGGATAKWHFLTGTPPTVHRLAYTTFHVGDLIGKMEHSTEFILVDKNGNIRGYYSTFDADGVQMLLKDVNALRNTRS